MSLAPGDQLGHYAIVSLVGTGGMGEVYKARDTRLERLVALKLLPAALSAVADRRRRFVNEAKAASALSHPNIAHIYEIGEDGERLYLAMEYIEGQTLHERITAKTVTPREAIAFGSQIAAALAEAHSKRIVHRDIKPANVMITKQGLVKVLDFGLAKIMSETVHPDDATVMRTTPGVVMGTLDYMSPEQSRGGDVDHRTDIYSLGVVLHEMAGGNAPSRLTRVVQRCLERDREKRWQSASEIISELQASNGSRRTWVIAAAGGLAAVGIGGWAVLRPKEVIDSVAVLPLANSSGNADMEYLGGGIAQSLINSLSELPGLKVKSLISVAKHKSTEPQELGRTLAVRAVVTGSVMQRGDDLAIAVQLVDARSGDQIWGERYQRKVTNILALQEEIAKEIAGRLRQKLGGEQQKKSAKKYSENPEAYQAYLRGRYYCNKRTEEAIRKGIDSFQQAIDRDPSYALAYAGLADGYMLLTRYAGLSSHEPYSKAAALIRRALEIDSELPEAHAALGYYKGVHEYDWKGSEAECRRSIALNPNLAISHLWYAAACLMPVGRLEESEREMRRALELEPLTVVISCTLGRAIYYRRDWDRALGELKKCTDLDPSFAEAMIWLGRVYLVKGMHAESIATLQTARRLRGATNDFGALGYALGVSGARKDAEAVLTELTGRKSFNPYDAALIHLGLGNSAKAMEQLEAAVEGRWAMILTLNIDPAFDSIRSEPRVQAVLRRMHLI